MSSPAILVVGTNHLSSPIYRRERIAVLEENIPETLAWLKNAAGLDEAVILSTCSRFEVIACADKPQAAAARLRDWFLERAGAELATGIYVKSAQEAVRHLFRVTAGLDSWILGEAEIQGQVKKAYQRSLALDATGRVLNQAFQRALSAGKAIRTQTGIQDGIRSIGGAAALLAKQIFASTQSGQVVVFGAGEAAQAVARHLAAKNFGDLWVANRTLERAQAVADSIGGKALGFSEGLRLLAEAEAAIFSASCAEVLLDARTLAPLLKGRRRPLFLIDLGLPRNIEEACGRLPGVYLYNLDDLKNVVRESMERKGRDKERAEAMATVAAGECAASLAGSGPRPQRRMAISLLQGENT